jgi:tetratricopeptide (TPR) repeat protein
MRCPQCGQENPEGFRFCGSCGAALEAPASATREERKVVTVLFADLVGFTARAEAMDPEDVRALLAPYHQRLREELDDALCLADEALARAPGGLDVPRRALRSQIRLARGLVQEAVDDAAKAVEAARARDDPSIQYALAVHTRASLAAEALTNASQALSELLERLVEGKPLLSTLLPDFAVASVELDQAEAFRHAIAALKKQTPWVEAARAFAEGDFTAAGEIYIQIGSRPDAACAWLRAGREETVQLALDFYRSVGATRYVREGEALLAAAS